MLPNDSKKQWVPFFEMENVLVKKSGEWSVSFHNTEVGSLSRLDRELKLAQVSFVGCVE